MHDDPLRAWLDAEGLRVDATDDGAVLDVHLPDPPGRTLRIVHLAGSGLWMVAMTAAPEIPVARWSALYPLLAEANAELAMGAWLLDTRTSRLLFRVGLPAEGASYDAACLRALLGHVVATVGTMERAFEAAHREAGASSALDALLAAWAEEEPA
jgi:hypothetical protein